jgi:hypothetical protein
MEIAELAAAVVMAGLVPSHPRLSLIKRKDVDAPDRRSAKKQTAAAGHDEI